MQTSWLLSPISAKTINEKLEASAAGNVSSAPYIRNCLSCRLQALIKGLNHCCRPFYTLMFFDSGHCSHNPAVKVCIKEALNNSSMNDQRKNRIKMRFYPALHFQWLISHWKWQTSVCRGNSELIRVSLIILLIRNRITRTRFNRASSAIPCWFANLFNTRLFARNVITYDTGNDNSQ